MKKSIAIIIIILSLSIYSCSTIQNTSNTIDIEKEISILGIKKVENPVIVYNKGIYYIMDSIEASKHDFNNLKKNWSKNNKNVYFIHPHGIELSSLIMEVELLEANNKFKDKNYFISEQLKKSIQALQELVDKGKITYHSWYDYIEKHKIFVIRTHGIGTFIMCQMPIILYDANHALSINRHCSKEYIIVLYSLDYTKYFNAIQ